MFPVSKETLICFCTFQPFHGIVDVSFLFLLHGAGVYLMHPSEYLSRRHAFTRLHERPPRVALRAHMLRFSAALCCTDAAPFRVRSASRVIVVCEAVSMYYFGIYECAHVFSFFFFFTSGCLCIPDFVGAQSLFLLNVIVRGASF